MCGYGQNPKNVKVTVLTVELCEVGPRDGIQFESRPFDTELKIELIQALAAAGIPRIQATSFVHPKWVPQMADAESIAERLLGDARSTIYSALALNVRGVERALAAGFTAIDLSIATNETHSRDNANMTVEEGVAQAVQMIERSNTAGVRPQLGLQTVFGYGAPGDTSIDFIADLAAAFCERDIESLSLADSTGMANPVSIRRAIDRVSAVAGDVPIVLHLHDTRGLGMANVFAAYISGVRRFDTSVGGLGGCPFIPGATGNISTEDTVYMLESMGIDTEVDGAAVSAIARRIEAHVGRQLPGKMHSLE
ncbi:MAG: hydroxymethylglutaryl-CoA lyase [Bacteroidetes bacterium]|nr:hydroxymethylglutaryl-CoA lyase [Bacteroidota bacterium]